MKLIQLILDWSEVWALLIPLIVFLVHKPKDKHLHLLVWYVIIGFFLNLVANSMLSFYQHVPSWMYYDNNINNNLLYNIHSFVRVLLVSWYIINIRQYRFPQVLKALLTAYIVFMLVNFTFLESPFFLSTRLYAAESIVLLIFCLTYFFHSIQDDSKVNWIKHPSFLVCAGISLYEVITFFIFLFFYPLSQKDPAFFVVTMQIYIISFVLFCILLALAFYRTKKLSKQIDDPGNF